MFIDLSTFSYPTIGNNLFFKSVLEIIILLEFLVSFKEAYLLTALSVFSNNPTKLLGATDLLPSEISTISPILF